MSALPAGPEAELAAALVITRRRRIGPFRQTPPPDAQAVRRERGVLARAGFAAEIAGQALSMPRAEAEADQNDRYGDEGRRETRPETEVQPGEPS